MRHKISDRRKSRVKSGSFQFSICEAYLLLERIMNIAHIDGGGVGVIKPMVISSGVLCVCMW